MENLPHHILVVDDVLKNLQITALILKENGYSFSLAQNGKAALSILQSETPDLILLDVMMPEMDGYEVCRLIKQDSKLKDIPVIFLTGKIQPDDLLAGFEVGGVDYITKPFQSAEVIARISAHIKISWQKRELERVNREKDRFLSIIAHDLRSPFNTILGFLNLLELTVVNNDTENITLYAKYANQMAISYFNLLEDILVWARAQSDGIPFKPEMVSVFSLVSGVIETLTPTAFAKSIIIKNSISEDLNVFADTYMLKTIVRNLVSNAIKFTNQHGEIDLTAEISGAAIKIIVSDNGVGMDANTVAKLFDSTQKISMIGTGNESGTGLGLLLCKDFVRKHGGDIWVESEVGHGSKFAFNLPLVKA